MVNENQTNNMVIFTMVHIVCRVSSTANVLTVETYRSHKMTENGEWEKLKFCYSIEGNKDLRKYVRPQ